MMKRCACGAELLNPLLNARCAECRWVARNERLLNEPAVEPADMTPRPASAESNAAYRQGRCIDCFTAGHAPGRPRCDVCDAIRVEKMNRGGEW